MPNILDCTPIAQFAIDRDHRITHWNRALAELTGIPASRMIGTRDQWKPFYPQKRPVLADLIVDNNLNGLKKFYKNRVISKSEIIPSAWEATDFFKNAGGEDRHFYFLAAPILDSDGNITGAIETVQDITRRVLAESELRESQERYRVLTEQVADGEEAHNLRSENVRLKSQLKDRYGLGKIVGRSRPMQAVYENIIKAATCSWTRWARFH